MVDPREWFRRENDPLVSLVLRVFQVGCVVLALALYGASFPSQAVAFVNNQGQRVVITTHLGGPSINFAMLVTFSASVYTLGWLIFVRFRPTITPSQDVLIGLDAVFTVFLLSVGCAVAASDYVRHCSILSESVNCSVLRAATVFSLFSFVGFFASLGWGVWVRLGSAKHRSRQNEESVIDVLPLEGQDSNNRVDYLPESTAAYGQHGENRR